MPDSRRSDDVRRAEDSGTTQHLPNLDEPPQRTEDLPAEVQQRAEDDRQSDVQEPLRMEENCGPEKTEDIAEMTLRERLEEGLYES